MTDLKISQLQEKTSLVGNDVITILDSEDSNHNKKAKSDVINAYVFGETSTNVQGLTAKSSVAGGDIVSILDSADSNANKKTTASAINTYVFGETSTNVQGLTQKNSIADNDVLTILDSADNLAPKKVLAGAINPKQKTVTDTTSTTASVSVTENTVYTFTQPLTSLTLSSVADSLLESELDFTTGTSFSFTATPLTNKWINNVPTWIANTHYIISIKSGYATWGIVGY